MAQLTPEEISAEAAERPRAAYFAIVAGVLSLLGGIGSLVFQRSLPTATASKVVDVLEAMQARVVDDTAPPRSFNAVQIEYIGDHLIGWIGPQLLTSLGVLLLIVPVVFVFRATRARKDDLRSLGGTMVVVGAVTSGIGVLVYTVVIGIDASSFSGSSVADTRDMLTSQPAIASQVVGIIGRIALAVGLIVVSLNAMRVGLLTRFVGILGIIVGITVVFGGGGLDQINLLRSSWLVFVGLLLLGKMPGAYRDPPAWSRGEAIPWPSQQELRERREAEAAAAGGADDGGDDAPERRSRKRRK